MDAGEREQPDVVTRRPVRTTALSAELVRLLDRGELDEAMSIVAASSERTPLIDVIELDIRSRYMDADVHEVQDLARHVAVEAPELRWWLDAVLAERMMVDGDVLAAGWAASVLRDLPQEPYPPFPVLYARGRLARTAAVGRIALPSPENVDAFRSLRDRSIDDLLRCGFRTEARVTAKLLNAWGELFVGGGGMAAFAQIRAAHELVSPKATLLGLMIEQFYALLAFGIGDMPAAHESLDRLARSAHPMHRAVAAVGRALATTIGHRGDPATLPALDDALAGLASVSPRNEVIYANAAAHALADLGRPEMVRYAEVVLAMPPIGPVATLDHRLLRARMAAAGGERFDVDEVLTTLDRLAEEHHGRTAGVSAWRMARDLVRLGDPAGAARLRAWGDAHYGPRHDMTPWEQVWRGLDPVDDLVTATADGGAPTPVAVTVRVLRPSLELVIGRATVRLPSSSARLLLTLLVHHPQPLHVERLAELLWPDRDGDARSRLNSAVHRLRNHLGVQGEAIRRHDDLVHLCAEGWDVDLLRLRADLVSPARRHDALTAVAGNLCDAQFPYDEHLVEARHRFTAEWLHHARAATRRGSVGVGDLGGALAALGLTADDL